MPKNRKAAEEFILEFINSLAPGNPNVEFYKQEFASMSDADFDKYMAKLASGEVVLDYVSENNTKFPLSVERNIKIAKKIGHKFWHRIWLGGENGIPPYLSTHAYPVWRLPYRRQAQLQEKKVRIPENNRTVDNLTGQPTGKSKGASISLPETQVLAALKLDNNLVEFIKLRGGDEKGFNAMMESIAKTGGVSQEAIAPQTGTVKVNEVLHAILTSMHLKSTLNQKA